MYEDLGRMLRHLRKERGETLEQVADATGLSIAMLSRLERGERLPSPESIEVLAAHFAVEPDALLGETIAHRISASYGVRGRAVAAERFQRDELEAPFPPSASDSAAAARMRKGYTGFSAMPLGDLGATSGAPESVAPASASEGYSFSHARMSPQPAQRSESAEAWDLVAAAVRTAQRVTERERDLLGDAERLEVVARMGQVSGDTVRAIRGFARHDRAAQVRAVAHKMLDAIEQRVRRS